MKLISATKANKLHSKQWVNIYELSLIGAEFYDCCQVKDLDLDEPSEYSLELIEGGTVIEQGDAVK